MSDFQELTKAVFDAAYAIQVVGFACDVASYTVKRFGEVISAGLEEEGE